MRRLGVFVAVLLLSMAVSASENSNASGRRPVPGLFVAHALGAIDGDAYLNCKECFLHSYATGFRLFEIDLVSTPDHRVVAMHDGLEKRFGLPMNFTHAQFMSRKLDGKFTPVDGAEIGRLMQQKRDWYLVTDVKDGNESTLRLLCTELAAQHIDCKDRVIPQLYNFSEIGIEQKMKFKRSILTLYRFDKPASKAEVVAFVAQHPEISAVTMAYPYWEQDYTDQLRRVGAQTFVHTVNEPNVVDRFLNAGVGIYTDSFYQKGLRR
jgi:glycerophosphoryl diester phosphodiesterase